MNFYFLTLFLFAFGFNINQMLKSVNPRDLSNLMRPRNEVSYGNNGNGNKLWLKTRYFLQNFLNPFD